MNLTGISDADFQTVLGLHPRNIEKFSVEPEQVDGEDFFRCEWFWVGDDSEIPEVEYVPANFLEDRD